MNSSWSGCQLLMFTAQRCENIETSVGHQLTASTVMDTQADWRHEDWPGLRRLIFKAIFCSSCASRPKYPLPCGFAQALLSSFDMGVPATASVLSMPIFRSQQQCVVKKSIARTHRLACRTLTRYITRSNTISATVQHVQEKYSCGADSPSFWKRRQKATERP